MAHSWLLVEAFGRSSQVLALWASLSGCLSVFVTEQQASLNDRMHTHTYIHTTHTHTHHIPHGGLSVFLWPSLISHCRFYHFLFIRRESPDTAHTIAKRIRPPVWREDYQRICGHIFTSQRVCFTLTLLSNYPVPKSRYTLLTEEKLFLKYSLWSR